MIQNGLEESSNLLIAIEAAQINQNEELISGTSESIGSGAQWVFCPN